MKNMIILLNKEEKNFGHVLNGLSHVSFGAGHKIPDQKLPNISVRFAGSKEIYSFRQKAYDLFEKNKKEAFYSDFITAMNSVMEFEKHIEYVKSFKESQLTYLCVLFCADEKITDELMSDFSSMLVLKNYSPLITPGDSSSFEFCPGVEPEYKKPLSPKKIVMSLHPKESLSVILNSMIVAAIELGKKVPHENLNIMPWVDADNNQHFNISLHPFPILMAKNVESQKTIVSELSEKSSSLYSYTSADLNQNPLAICGFGETESVSKVFDKEKCGVWRKSPANKDFVQNNIVFSKAYVGSKQHSVMAFPEEIKPIEKEIKHSEERQIEKFDSTLHQQKKLEEHSKLKFLSQYVGSFSSSLSGTVKVNSAITNEGAEINFFFNSKGSIFARYKGKVFEEKDIFVNVNDSSEDVPPYRSLADIDLDCQKKIDMISEISKNDRMIRLSLCEGIMKINFLEKNVFLLGHPRFKTTL